MDRLCLPVPKAWERPVFVFTTGRSGSTLLLRYLNCAQDLIVWGEHAAFVTELAACYAKLTSATTTAYVEAAQPWLHSLLEKKAIVCPSEKMTIEWVNPFTQESIRSAFRGLFFALLNDRIGAEFRWGFKEIHYAFAEIALLRALFEGSRFLLLVRNPAAILKSKFQWFAGSDAARMQAHFDETCTFFRFAQAEVAARRPDTLLVHYEALAEAPEQQLTRIADFVGTAFIEEQVRAIAGERRASAATSARRDPDAALRNELLKMNLDPGQARIVQLSELYASLLVAERIEHGDEKSAGSAPEVAQSVAA